LTPEDVTDTMSRNVGNYIPLLTVQYPIRAQLLSTSRRKTAVTHVLTLHYRYGLYKTVAKVHKMGDIDVVSMMVQWPIQCVMSPLCGVQRDRSWWKDVVLCSSWAEPSGCVRNLY
jgi:hypothetical protein